jgi:hypothetical protein
MTIRNGKEVVSDFGIVDTNFNHLHGGFAFLVTLGGNALPHWYAYLSHPMAWGNYSAVGAHLLFVAYLYVVLAQYKSWRHL